MQNRNFIYYNSFKTIMLNINLFFKEIVLSNKSSEINKCIRFSFSPLYSYPLANIAIWIILFNKKNYIHSKRYGGMQMIKYRLNKYPLSHALCEMHLLLNSPSVEHINKWIQNYEEKSSRFLSIGVISKLFFLLRFTLTNIRKLKNYLWIQLRFYLFMFCKMSHFKYF